MREEGDSDLWASAGERGTRATRAGERAWDAGVAERAGAHAGMGRRKEGVGPGEGKGNGPCAGSCLGRGRGREGAGPSAGLAARRERGRRTGLMGFLGRVSVGLGFSFPFFTLFSISKTNKHV